MKPISDYSYSHSNFVKETIKLHLLSLKSLLVQPLQNSNESTYIDQLNEYF